MPHETLWIHAEWRIVTDRRHLSQNISTCTLWFDKRAPIILAFKLPSLTIINMLYPKGNFTRLPCMFDDPQLSTLKRSSINSCTETSNTIHFCLWSKLLIVNFACYTLKMISSLYWAVSTPQCLRVSHHGICIHSERWHETLNLLHISRTLQSIYDA